MKIIILGGSGYIGAVLCNLLIYHGHKIKVIDAQWFGKNLRNNKNKELDKINENAAIQLEKTLSEYGVDGKIIGFSSGPIVTLLSLIHI